MNRLLLILFFSAFTWPNLTLAAGLLPASLRLEALADEFEALRTGRLMEAFVIRRAKEGKVVSADEVLKARETSLKWLSVKLKEVKGDIEHSPELHSQFLKLEQSIAKELTDLSPQKKSFFVALLSRVRSVVDPKKIPKIGSLVVLGTSLLAVAENAHTPAASALTHDALSRHSAQ